MFKINIHCKEKWFKAMELSRENHDETFSKCFMRLLSCCNWWNVSELNIGSDFCEHSFTFSICREDGSVSLNGGMIFHGFPKDGYRENGSVQIEPEYGWSIHT